MPSKKEPERKRLHIVSVHLYEMQKQAKLIGSVEVRIWLPMEQGGNVRKEVRKGLLSTVYSSLSGGMASFEYLSTL